MIPVVEPVLAKIVRTTFGNSGGVTGVGGVVPGVFGVFGAVSYTHLTLPTILLV